MKSNYARKAHTYNNEHVTRAYLIKKKQCKQYTYNVVLRRVRLTSVAMGTQ
jgi:hypothetical protein